MQIRDYVEEMFRGVPDSAEKRGILEEMIADAEEKAADLMAAGKAEEDAVNKALVELGDLSEIKLSLLEAAAPRPDGMAKYRNSLLYAICGSLLVIGLMLFVNFTYSPNVIWFVYPTFAVLWWPLSVLLHYLNRKAGDWK